MAITTTEHWVPTQGGKLYSKCWQPNNTVGVPIILLHDSLGSTVQWRDLPEKLAQASKRKVVAYDRLGYGQSAPRSDTVTRDYVTDEANEGFRAVLEHFAIDEFVVFGHSVGGCMGICIAGIYGNRCQGLVSIAAQTLAEDCTVASIKAAKQALSSPEQWPRMVKYHGENAQWVMDTWVNTWTQEESLEDWHLFAYLAALTCPVLVVHGKNDEFGSLAHPQSVQDHASTDVTLMLLDGVGHVPHREKPAEVLAAVQKFLA